MKCIKLTYKSPMYGSISCDDAESFGYACIDLDPEMLEQIHNQGSELEEFLRSNTEDLSDFVPEELKDLVVRAEFGDYASTDMGMAFLTAVYVRRMPDSKEFRLIQEWITGQLADGWGEGLEQKEFMEVDVKWYQPEFDCMNCTWFTQECRAVASYYVHPWTPNGFGLDLIMDEVVDLAIADKDLEEIKNTMQEIQQKLRELEVSVQNLL